MHIAEKSQSTWVCFLSGKPKEQDGAPGLSQALWLAHGPSECQTRLQLVWGKAPDVEQMQCEHWLLKNNCVVFQIFSYCAAGVGRSCTSFQQMWFFTDAVNLSLLFQLLRSICASPDQCKIASLSLQAVWSWSFFTDIYTQAHVWASAGIPFMSSKVRCTWKCIFSLVKCHVCDHIQHFLNAVWEAFWYWSQQLFF